MVIYLGSLVQLCCGEGGTLQISLVCGGSACSVWGTQGLPPLMGKCAVLVYTAQASGCSAGELSKVGPGLHVLPMSNWLRFRFAGTPQRHRLGWACGLCPSQVRAAQATRFLVRTLSPGGWCILSPPRSQSLSVPGAQRECHLRCAMCLLWGADLWHDPPGGCQPSRIPGRLA